MLKRIGIVILGLVASFLVFGVIMFLIVKAKPSIEGDDAYLWIPILISLPIGFFAGSIVTGYFSYYVLESKWSLVFMPPGLYCVWLMLIQWTVPEDGGFSWKGFLFIILGSMVWYLPSLAGVVLGYFLRFKIICWWYGFNDKGEIVRPYKADDKEEFRDRNRFVEDGA